MNSKTGQLDWSALHPGPVVPDLARHYLSPRDFVQQFFDSTTLPKGHGFLPIGTPRYVTSPKPGVPIRMIVLNTVSPLSIPGMPAHYGSMTREQFYDFLVPQVEAARQAGEFVLIVSHHPSEDFDLPCVVPSVSTAVFRSYLASQPNVIAHICGHIHVHRIRRIEGDYPYLEICTASLADYPQEGRILEIWYDAQQKTITIRGHAFSHIEHPTHLSAEAFELARQDAAYTGDWHGGSLLKQKQSFEVHLYRPDFTPRTYQ